MTIATFLQSTDVHGVKFIADTNLSMFRRLAWLLVLLGSSISLAVLIIIRVQYYSSYPTVYNSVVHPDFIPAPAVLVCTAESRGIPIYFPRVDKDNYNNSVAAIEEELQNFTDIDMAYFLYFGLKIQIFSEAEDGLYKLDGRWMNYLFNLSVDPSRSAYESVLRGEGLSHNWYTGTRVIFYKIVERIQQMDRSTKINPENDLLSFLERHGLVNQLFLQGQVTCSATYGGAYISRGDCKWSQVMSQTGTCLLFNGDGRLKYQRVLGLSGFKIWLRLSDMLVPEYEADSNDFIDLKLEGIFDPKEFPISFPHRYKKDLPASNMSTRLNLNIGQSYYSKVLDQPYSEQPCTEHRSSYCVRECVAKRAPCKMLWIHDAENARNKPFCSLSQPQDEFLAYDWKLIHMCMEHCPLSCEDTHYKIEPLPDFPGDLYSNHPITRAISIYAEDDISFVEYIQESQYSLGALVAEVGGYMGLFLGASSLTVYHWLEYGGVRLSRFIRRARTNRGADTSI